jgi:hypothetical protein
VAIAAHCNFHEHFCAIGTFGSQPKIIIRLVTWATSKLDDAIPFYLKYFVLTSCLPSGACFVQRKHAWCFPTDERANNWGPTRGLECIGSYCIIFIYIILHKQYRQKAQPASKEEPWLDQQLCIASILMLARNTDA